MIETIITGSEEYGRWVKALVVGEPGSGKTLLSSTFPNPYYASAEGGTMSIAHKKLPITKIQSSDQLLELLMILDQTPKARSSLLKLDRPVETVVLDTIDEIQNIIIRERLEAEKKTALTLPDYGWLREQMRTIIRNFRNLDMHVVFTCHVKESRDDELGRIVYKPGMQGGIADEMAGFVDLALFLTARSRLEIVNNQPQPVIERLLTAFPDTQHPWVKDRSGRLPAEIPVNFKDDFDRIYKLIFEDIDNDLKVLADPLEDLKVRAPEIVVSEGEFICEDCGVSFASQDQADLSRLRVRHTLCKPCYKSFNPDTFAEKEKVEVNG